MKRTVPLLIALGLGFLNPAASRCTAPAATLLLPYFEVDLGNPNGITTMFSVNNASSLAVLAHVVVYSDLSVPVLDFNIYLTGYDVQTINLRDILVTGVLPQTASAGQDPKDTISPSGKFSQDVDFPNCTGQLPPPNLPANFLQHLQLSLTGKASPLLGGLCAGRNLGDNIARGYMTIDTVNNCTLRLPTDPAYFADDITFQNVLWGDYFYVNTGENLAQGNPLVHIPAEDPVPSEITPPSRRPYTFYGRYVAWSGVDRRRPLATNFAVRYSNGGSFGGGSSLIVWRDSKTVQQAFSCPATAGSRPAWYLLGQEGIVIFNDQESSSVPLSNPSSPQVAQQSFAPFPAEAQRVKVGSANFPSPFSFGWLYLNLNTSVSRNPNPSSDPAAAQAWVTVTMDTEGRFSVGFDAIQLDNASRALHQIPGPP